MVARHHVVDRNDDVQLLVVLVFAPLVPKETAAFLVHLRGSGRLTTFMFVDSAPPSLFSDSAANIPLVDCLEIIFLAGYLVRTRENFHYWQTIRR